MLFVLALALLQIGRAAIMYFADGTGIDTAVIGLLCLAVAEVIRRQNRAVGMGDEEKEVIPNRPHPLEKPQRARPSVQSLPSDK